MIILYLFIIYRIEFIVLPNLDNLFRVNIIGKNSLSAKNKKT